MQEQSVETCICYGQEHRLYNCPKYNELTIDEKTKLIKENRLCFNCLRYGHRLQDCPSASKRNECNCHCQLPAVIALNAIASVEYTVVN